MAHPPRLQTIAIKRPKVGPDLPEDIPPAGRVPPLSPRRYRNIVHFDLDPTNSEFSVSLMQ